MSKSVLTIATGKDVYIRMAVNLARSFFYWHRDDQIQFAIATDQPRLIPPDLIDKITTIPIKPGEFGQGFSPKLYLDKLALTEQTLFIDSDCLITANLNFIFNKFQGNPVSVVGGFISEGEWFGNVKKLCKKFGFQKIPKFNGGLYYLEKGSLSNQVYEKARELESQYDELGLIRLRNRPNDELLMSISMAYFGLTPIPDDGTIMSDPQACPGPYDLKVSKGLSFLINPPPPDPKHQSWYPFYKVSPTIVHFLGHHTHEPVYKREAFSLDLYSRKKIPPSIADGISQILIFYPEVILLSFKNWARPFYRILFGVRRVKQSDRI
ncbi:MAG: hypothetical protein WA004_17250 [Saprospiraceae bacterium]